MEGLIFFVFSLVMVMVIAVKSILQVGENQRAVILRISKFHQLVGPGLHIIIPIIDVAIVVNLSKHFPDWQSLSDEAIDEQVKKLVLFDPDPKKYK